MDLGQGSYSRILGVNVFIVHSTLRNRTCVHFFNEQTAKKGSDEVISVSSRIEKGWHHGQTLFIRCEPILGGISVI
jgi:hypothetical protein